jgi:hypothetical protein
VTVSFRGTAALVAAMTISLVLTGSAGAFPGETSVASVNSAGSWVPGGSGELPCITADGRYVVFSTPGAMVPEDTNQDTTCSSATGILASPNA